MNMDSDNSLNIPKKEENDGTVEIEIPFEVLQYLSLEGSCIQSLCRICLKLQENMTCLFSSSPALHELLSDISSMQPQFDDGLPSQICLECEAYVRNCHLFKQKCDKAEYTLKSLLKGEFPLKERDSNSDQFKTKSEPLADEPEKYADTAIYLIEQNEQCYPNRNENNNDNRILKEEYEIHEDIEYLDALSDEQIDAETLDIPKEDVQHKKKKEDFISDTKLISKKDLTDNDESLLDNGQICAYCSKRFKTQKALETHIKKRHTDANCHPCPQCKDVFHSEHDLFVHSALHDKGAVWMCNKCSKVFKTRAMLRRHIYRHMESKRFTCTQCGKAFVEHYALRRHMRVHTGEQREKKHKCQICDKRYSEISLLTAHMTSHSGVKPWSCSECGKQFASARLLGSHRLVHSTRKPYQCQYCNRRFRHESTRNTHHRTHTGEKPYVCATCGKTFIQNSNLRLHMRTHTGERPYSCALCSSRFTSSSSLKAHALTHQPERPVPCSYCNKRFSQSSLKAHMRLHVAERPYKCNICPKKFITATRLRDHCRIHTGEKPFECAICGLKFITKAHVRQHLRHHEDILRFANKPSVMKKKPKKVDEKQTKPPLEEVNYSVDQVPLDVTGELVVQSENNEQTDILVVDNNQRIDKGLQSSICLEGVTYVNDDDVMIMNENGMSISSTSATLEGNTVKLYHIDQSLVQIHSAGSQVTISQITSKMTTNF